MRSVRIGKRLLLSVLAASLAGLAQTAPRAVPDDGWDLSPLAWNRTGDRVGSTGFSDLAFARSDASEGVVVEAELTPLDVKPGAGWPVAGLVVGLGERDYWHLAFVQPPASHRARRLIELAEMRDGSWLAQEGDGLRTLPGGVPSESWCTNVTYRFRLEATQESVVGTVRDAAGKIVFRKGYGLTDRPAVKGGRAGLRASEGFKCAFAQVCASSSGRPLVTAKDAFPPYASDSFVKGIESRATGVTSA